MIDLHVCYEQVEAFELSKTLKDKGVDCEVEECSKDLQAYTPAMVKYIIKVKKEDEERANQILDDVFE